MKEVYSRVQIKSLLECTTTSPSVVHRSVKMGILAWILTRTKCWCAIHRPSAERLG